MANELARNTPLISGRLLLWILLIVLSTGAAIGILMAGLKGQVFIIGGIALIVNLYVMSRWPIYGLLLYLFIFMYRPGEVYPVLAAIRLEFIVGVTTLILTIIHRKMHEGVLRLPVDRVTVSLLAFWVVIYLTTLTSFNPMATIDKGEDFAKTLIFYYLIVTLIDTRPKLNAFILLYVLLIGKVCYDAYTGYQSGAFIHTMGMDRMTGATSMGGDPNSLASTIAISIPLVVGTAIVFKNYFYRIPLLVMAVGMLMILGITGSRGGFLAAIGVLIGGFVFARNKFVTAFVIILLALAFWVTLPGQYQARYLTLTDVDDLNQTSTGRWDIWKTGIQMFINRPLLGIGIGAFPTAHGSGAFGGGSWIQPHNFLVQLAAESGIVGIVVWMGLFFRNVVRNIGKLRRIGLQDPSKRWVYTYATSFAISIIALWVAGMFGHNLFRFNWYVIAALSVAMLTIVERDKQDSPPTSAASSDETPKTAPASLPRQSR
jgi:putative inorganic carbon (hco3(-)) transporter